jgi:oligopeptide/dipeptide ABC transporter ATP-binding protein
MAIILITHDLGVVARMAQEVAVMYAGKIVERGSVDDIFYRSSHPYTLGLRAAMPSNDPAKQHKLLPIEGSPPDLFHPPAGCGYCARCPYAMQVCEGHYPPQYDLGPGHTANCWLHHERCPEHPDILHFLEVSS